MNCFTPSVIVTLNDCFAEESKFNLPFNDTFVGCGSLETMLRNSKALNLFHDLK